LPVISPQNMACEASGAFTSGAFVRIGSVLTVAAAGVTMLLAACYWRWIGLLPAGGV
jgi:di/tricarboxylate transporter